MRFPIRFRNCNPVRSDSAGRRSRRLGRRRVGDGCPLSFAAKRRPHQKCSVTERSEGCGAAAMPGWPCASRRRSFRIDPANSGSARLWQPPALSTHCRPLAQFHCHEVECNGDGQSFKGSAQELALERIQARVIHAGDNDPDPRTRVQRLHHAA